MAARYPIPPPAADPVETQINRAIDGLIALLNLRRDQLLTQVRKACKEKRAAEVARQEMQTQLTTAQTHLLTDLKDKSLKSFRDKTVSEIEQKLGELRMNIPVETQLKWQCDTRDFEVSISRLGEIAQVPVGHNYATFNLPTVATGEEGIAPGELSGPSGVAINEATNQIFVVNCRNRRVEIFSETGEYLNQFGNGRLYHPNGIAIHGNSVYISSDMGHNISKYSLIDFSFVKRIGERGSNNGEFQTPYQLTTDPNGQVFIADSGNNRICVFDTDLNHVRNITHQEISKPHNIKLWHDRVYVLCPLMNPCMLVLSLEGDLFHSIISCGRGMDVLDPCFFCLDANNNIVISDGRTHSIRVFSPAGNLLHTIGRKEHEQGMFYQPYGITIDTNGRLVCVSNNKNFGLQIFC